MRQFDDAFAIYSVSADHVYNTFYGTFEYYAGISRHSDRLVVAGCLPYINKYSVDRAKGAIVPYEMNQYVRAVRELAEFQLIDGLPFVLIDIKSDEIYDCFQGQKAAEASPQFWGD